MFVNIRDPAIDDIISSALTGSTLAFLLLQQSADQAVEYDLFAI